MGSSLHSPQPLSDICLYWRSFLYSDLILKVKLKFCFNGIIVQPCCNIFHLLFKRFHLSWYSLYLYWALLQHLLVDHISCFIKWLSWHGLDSKGAAIWCTHPGWSRRQFPVRVAFAT